MTRKLIRYFVLAALLLVTAFCFYAFGASKLVYIGKEDGWIVKYDKESVKKIDANIMEVYAINTIGGGTTKTQVRFNCATHKESIGSTYDLINNKWSFVDNFSKNGWSWNSPTAKTDKKIGDIICKGR